jgi:hypothetical protein
MTASTVLAVFFDDGFWKAVLERHDDGHLSIAQHLFEAEPSDAEVYHWWLTRSGKLVFTLPVPFSGRAADRSSSQKKKARRAAREILRAPLSEEIRAVAQADRKRRRLAEKAAQRRQRLAFQQMKRDKRTEKARNKKRGH